MKKAVVLNDVSMKYQSVSGETEAIKSISFDVKEGEFLSIVGPSGCGKSTLLSIIAGLVKPTSGEALVMGEPAGSANKTGYMLQNDHLFEWRTIMNNVILGQQIKHCATYENRMYAEELLKTYGLYEFKDRYPRELSGGMRQRAALIRTLAVRPDILLLDEAFSGLDYQTRLAVSDDIYAIIRREKKTVVMVTHDISESVSMSDRVVILSKRPAEVKRIVDIDFSGKEALPLERRESAEFKSYFNVIWKELGVHV
ncbi:MAG: ABC transporter ATP-binding protein [Christensenellaceae bacterium]|nr:ABC transporter ATP-binding protein [Christensenellaceae bacterium]